MNLSKNGADFIKNEEKCELKAYRDQAGVPTIGWGNTMYPNGKPVQMGDSITQTYADSLFAWAAEIKLKAILPLLGNTPLNQNQLDALISLAYNIGSAGFKNSTVLKRVKANPNDPTIRDAFMMWNKITDPKTKQKIVSKGLTIRRRREADLYFKAN